MDNGIKKHTCQIEEMQQLLRDYYKCFCEYYYANGSTDNIYSVAHSNLVEDSIKLQVCFIKLPKELQNRLLAIDFEVLLQCNNVVDFYSFREFIIANNKFYTIATIVERADAELKLALEIDKEGIWNNYSMLPKINLNFYRIEKYESMLEENQERQNNVSNERSQEIENNNLNSNQWNNRIEQIDDKPTERMMDKFVEFVDQGNKAIDKSTETIEKSTKLIGVLSPIFKVTWELIKSNLFIK